MKKIYTVTIEKLIPGGKGMSRIEGRVVFVPFVLPGEKVNISIMEEKKNYFEAELISILERSTHRVEPPCRYYYKCGGCNMQHMDYETQLKMKIDFAENLLLRNGKILQPDIEIIRSKPLSYRNRVQIHNDGSAVGFKERAGNTVIPISHCPISVGGINNYLTSRKGDKVKDRLTVFGNDQWYSSELSGEEIHIDVNGKEIFFDSSLFFQSNVSLLPELSDYLNIYVSGKILLDLYCGVGLLSSMVEEKFQKIYAVEINKHVQPYIDKNIRIDHEFYPLSLEKWCGNKRNILADTIIVDPPRTGLSKTVRKYLQRSRAGTIIYLSCDPATMARDLKDILADKYRIEDFKLFDFYPQTSHMEAVAVLKRSS